MSVRRRGSCALVRSCAMADASKILEVAKKRYKRTVDAQSDSKINQLDDRKFVAASPDNKWQWDNLALATRTTDGSSTARPALTVNLMPQHVYQVTNDQKQNRPAGKVLPVDDKADPKTAEVFNGIIRHIEVSSNADIAVDSACKSQVEEGEGFFRIVAEYADTDSFDQELKFKRIKDPFAVKMDPDIQDPTGSDAKFCFIEEPMTKEEFEEAFPDADPVSFSPGDRPADLAAWFNDGKLIVAEYYRVEQDEQDVCLWPDGQTTTGKDARKPYDDAQIKPVKERKAKVPVVKWCRTNGFQILGEEKVVPGDCIPVFRVVGNEWFVEGKSIVSGIVRNAKDPQRMVNYWWSQEAELLALAPKAPFVGYAGQFEGFETKWKQANVTNYPYLEANGILDSTGNAVLPLPQRMPPPMPPSGIIEAKVQALDAVKQTTGQYDASLGARSNETSGKAILARQREGDVGTYHYGANLALAVRAYCKYLVKVIPVYYDRKRVARIIGEDGEPSHATIDPQLADENGQPLAYKKTKTESGIEEIYNPCVGKYDVVASTGPSYTTKRQEAAEFMAQVLQGNKELMQVMGDLYFRMLDVPGVDEIADRLKRAVPPQLLGDEGDEDDPRVQQMNQVIEQLTQELHGAIDSLNSAETKIKEYDAETKRISALAKYLTPDVVAQIVGSSLLTSTDLDQINSRIAPDHEMQNPIQPPQQPQPGNGAIQ